MIIGIDGEDMLKDPLVIFSASDDKNLYGIIFKQGGGEVWVYSFEKEKSYRTSPSLCRPLNSLDYYTMCSNDWWTGITFTFKDNKSCASELCTIDSGVFDDTMFLNFTILCGTRARYPINLSQITLTGHIKQDNSL